MLIKQRKDSRDYNMVDLKELQARVYQNKIAHGFNVENIELEFCLAYGEMAEAYQAYRRHKDDLGEELADVAIYLLGLAEILGIDLEKEILAKIEKNSKRIYKKKDGVYTKIEG